MNLEKYELRYEKKEENIDYEQVDIEEFITYRDRLPSDLKKILNIIY